MPDAAWCAHGVRVHGRRARAPSSTTSPTVRSAAPLGTDHHQQISNATAQRLSKWSSCSHMQRAATHRASKHAAAARAQCASRSWRSRRTTTRSRRCTTCSTSAPAPPRCARRTCCSSAASPLTRCGAVTSCCVARPSPSPGATLVRGQGAKAPRARPHAGGGRQGARAHGGAPGQAERAAAALAHGRARHSRARREQGAASTRVHMRCTHALQQQPGGQGRRVTGCGRAARGPGACRRPRWSAWWTSCTSPSSCRTRTWRRRRRRKRKRRPSKRRPRRRPARAARALPRQAAQAHPVWAHRTDLQPAASLLGLQRRRVNDARCAGATRGCCSRAEGQGPGQEEEEKEGREQRGGGGGGGRGERRASGGRGGAGGGEAQAQARSQKGGSTSPPPCALPSAVDWPRPQSAPRHAVVLT